MKKIILSWLIISAGLNAGVVVLADLPQDVLQKIMEAAQRETAAAVGDIAQLENIELQFSPAEYAAHLSLAFVSPDKIANEEVKARYAKLLPRFVDIAKAHESIDLKVGEGASVNIWPGRFEMPCGGSKKKNYVNLVYALAMPDSLGHMTADIREVLKREYDIDQRFPFSAHLTLGRVCQKDDEPLSEGVVKALKDALDARVSSVLGEAPDIEISRFLLKGDDDEQDDAFIFDLKQEEEDK